MNPAFAAYIAPARRKAELWRLLLGLLLIVIFYYGFLLALLRLVAQMAHTFGVRFLQTDAAGNRFTSPTDMVFVLFSFSALIIALLLVTTTLHKRGLASLLGGNSASFRWHFSLVFHVVFPVFALLLLFSLAVSPATPNLSAGRWLMWLPLSLPLLLVQVSAEELVFRGYLQQQLAVRFRARWVWLFLPSALFGLLHYEPGVFGPNAWLVVAGTALFGLIAADLTARTGNLGAAIGLHFVNNLFALLIVAPAGDMTGFSLYVSGAVAADSAEMGRLLWLDLAVYLTGYIVFLRYLSRRAGITPASPD